MADDILYHNENGIEFWTVNATGESAMSIRGLARMCGVSHRSIRVLLFSLGNQNAPKILESLYGQEIYLGTKIVKRGKEIKAVRAAIATRIIRYYDKQGNATAEVSFDAFAEIGLESYIQGKTGWLPKEKQSSKSSRTLIDCILSDPKAWTIHFNPQWQREACRVTGYKWHPSRPMAQFISTYIYQALPKDVYARLLEVNSDRRKRHHQFFDDIADELILKEHIQQVAGLLRVSRSKTQFKRLFADAFGEGIQVDIEFDDAEVS